MPLLLSLIPLLSPSSLPTSTSTPSSSIHLCSSTLIHSHIRPRSDRASSEILSESGEFERENDNELEFEFEDHSSETEEIDAHEPSDEEYEREQEEAFMRERERRDKLQQMGVMKIDMRTLHKGEKEGAKEGSGRDSEVNSARSSAKDSARDTPRDSPRDSARNSARSSEGDGSQRDSARSSEGEGGHIHTLNNIQIDMSKVPGRDAEQAKKSGSGRGSMGETVSTRGSGPNSLRHVAEGERQFTSSRVTESERHVTNSKPHEPTRGPDWHRQSLTYAQSSPFSSFFPSLLLLFPLCVALFTYF